MLLMIPGPIEISPAVLKAFSAPPPSHVSGPVIEAHGHAIEQLRRVWCASPESQPFIIAGSGTIAMDIAVCNLIEPGDPVVVVNTGYFSDRIAEMARRRGAEVHQVKAPLGQTPHISEVGDTLIKTGAKVMLATHVDTSTGVRCDARRLSTLARELDVISVFDGVCATAGERFEMASWGADVYLTATQKAIGLPVGMALMVASERAMARRRALKTPPPMSLDWLEWLPIMTAYEARRPSYFSTPASNHLPALAVSLDEILSEGSMEPVFARHQDVADRLRNAWRALDLTLLPSPGLAANTLSAIRYPEGVTSSLVGEIKARGVIVAGGLHPKAKADYFRVGHMGYSTTQPDHIKKTVGAIADALIACGHKCDRKAAVSALKD